MYQPFSFNQGFQQTPFSASPTQLLRVNGLDSAKAYPTQPNSTVALFDANEDIMYIKSTDASNFPTIRRFKFEEIIENEEKTGRYVTIEEFNAFKEELLNGKQSIRAAAKSKPSNE